MEWNLENVNGERRGAEGREKEKREDEKRRGRWAGELSVEQAEHQQPRGRAGSTVCGPLRGGSTVIGGSPSQIL